MKIRIGIAHTSRVVEIESEDTDHVRSSIEEAFKMGHPVLWLTDSDGTNFGIPREMLAFVEFESPESRSGVGFAAGS
jgi:hypothetical protein